MRKRIHKICVTGGAGFIGSAFVRLLLNRDCPANARLSLNYKVIVIDKLTYAGDLKRLEEVKGKYKFYKADICNPKQIDSIFINEKPEIVVNFAAETHVDRSIHNAKAFIETNYLGTEILCQASRKHKVKRFIHISTDEVYGDIERGEFLEGHPLNPSSPYSAAKAAADLLIKSYIRTYKFPGIIIRPSNNYGPWQYPEKLIPLAILKIFRGEKIPLYAKGENVREWLYVEDCARGVLGLLEQGRLGEIYNLGSNFEKKNIEVIKKILNIMGAKSKLIKFVKDRPGHDIRYRLNCRKVIGETGWKPQVRFEQGITRTAKWCSEHKKWLLGKWKGIEFLYKNR